jgi:hypothetical protein
LSAGGDQPPDVVATRDTWQVDEPRKLPPDWWHVEVENADQG